MPRSKRIVLNLVTGTNNICAAQTTAGAGNLLLNGSSAETVPAMASARVLLLTGHKLNLASTGNLGGVNFTITGLDQNGNAVSEVIAGPNNNTVTTVNYFMTITKIAVSGAVGTNVTVGSSTSAISQTYPTNRYSKANPSATVAVTGTISYNVDHALGNPQITTLEWFTDTSAATSSMDLGEHLPRVIGALRVVVNSFSNGATCIIDIGDR